MTPHKRYRFARRSLSGERCEPRLCLAGVAFATHEIAATDAYRPSEVLAADLDGDGDLDVISSSQDDKIAWYENLDGRGGFGPQRVIVSTALDPEHSAGSLNRHLACADDVDGDGDLDVLVTSFGDDTITWYENTDGKGNFGRQHVITTAENGPASVDTGDLDRDGDVDVLSVSLNDGSIAWYENVNGKGDFGPQQVVAIAGAAAVVPSVDLGDVDGDGNLDVLIATVGESAIAWYANTDGKGHFGPQQLIATAATRVHSALMDDVDGDGDLDVISASWNDDTIAWYENTDGNGHFGPQQVITTEADGVISLYAGDFDGDGDLDVLAGCWQNDGEVIWYQNTDGLGHFEPRQVLFTLSDGASSVYAADLDGDGDLDALTATLRDSTIGWYENTDRLGNFGPRQAITTAAENAFRLSTGDLDGDGDLDVVAAMSHDGYKIAWYENTNGQGRFGPQQVITTEAEGAWSVFTGDLDGDGDLDVLSASWSDDKIAWYENTDGKGHFGPQQVITTEADGTRSVYASDLDGDGDLDVLSASQNDKTIAWYENTDGKGAFGPQRVISSVAYMANSVTTGDLDGDGDQDVLSAGEYEITWYENTDGKGKFGPPRVFTSNSHGARSVYLGDLDDDGDLDVVSASDSIYREVAWYRNTDGKGKFGPPQIIATVSDSYPSSVCAGDLDSDGDLDVIWASHLLEASISWQENLDGQGAFGPQQIIAAPADGTLWVGVADLDRDGDLDALSASDAQLNVAWHENLLPHPGDANRDGRFDSADFVQVFIAGEYEDDIEDNSTWEEGDWNGDGDFDSEDFVVAFLTGLYEVKSQVNTNSVAAAVDWLFANDRQVTRQRAYVA